MSRPNRPRRHPVGIEGAGPAIDMFMDFATKMIFVAGMAALLITWAITSVGCSEEPKAAPAEHGHKSEVAYRLVDITEI